MSARRKPVAHLVMRGDGAVCLRCGVHTRLPVPIPVTEAVQWSRDLEARHRACTPSPAPTLLDLRDAYVAGLVAGDGARAVGAKAREAAERAGEKYSLKWAKRSKP